MDAYILLYTCFIHISREERMAKEFHMAQQGWHDQAEQDAKIREQF